jgi:hypothetical protein
MAKKKSNAGRKKIVINWARVNSALEAGANGVQVAAMLGMHPDTLYNKCKALYNMDFSAYMQTKRESGNEKLLKAQYNLAIQENDRAMLIWLGKQRLNQSEKREVKQEFNGLNFKIVEDADGD